MHSIHGLSDCAQRNGQQVKDSVEQSMPAAGERDSHEVPEEEVTEGIPSWTVRGSLTRQLSGPAQYVDYPEPLASGQDYDHFSCRG